MLAKLIPFRDYLYALILVLLIGFAVYEHFHLIHEGEAIKLRQLQESSEKLNAKADLAIKKLEDQHTSTITALKATYEKQHEADTATHDSDASRLRDYDAYRRAHSPVQSAGAGSGSQQPPNGSADSDGGRFGRLEQVALKLADAGRESNVALKSCMDERVSITGN